MRGLISRALGEDTDDIHWITRHGVHIPISGDHARGRVFRAGRAGKSDKKVTVNKHFKSGVQVKYSAKFKKRAHDAKYNRVTRALEHSEYAERVLTSEAGKTRRVTPARATAAALLLMHQTGMRSSREGGGASDGKDTYGALSLQKKHVRVSGDKVSFSFPGKKGSKYEGSVKNKALATAIADLTKGKKSTDPVFGVTRYQAEQRYRKFHKALKMHDLRTARAMIIASEHLPAVIKKHKGKVPASKSEMKAMARRIKEAVAAPVTKALCHENPSTTLKSYISPSVIEYALHKCGFSKEQAAHFSESTAVVGSGALTLVRQASAHHRCPILRALFGNGYVNDWLRTYAENDEESDDDE